MQGTRVAVIGAGPAGLGAAWSLTDAGAHVTMYERAPKAGGLLRTEELDGARVDVAVQLVSSTHDRLLALAERAGARELLQRSPGRDALWRRDRAHAITYGSVTSMATSGALPTTLKLKLAGRYLPYLKGPASRLDANDPAGSGGVALDAESIGAWGRRELGDDFVELLVYPLLAAYYGALPEETSAPVYHALARVGMDVSVLAAAGGFGALAAAIAERLAARGAEIRTDAEATALALSDRGVHVESAAGAEPFDAAVLAVPANRAAALLRATSPALHDWLSSITVRPTFTLALRMERPHPGDYFGLSFPRTADVGRRIAALCVQSRKLPGLVPDGDALVVLPAPAAVPALLERTDEEITAALVPVLDKAVPGLSRRVASTQVYRIPDAYTLFESGHLRRLAAFDPALLPPRLALAGDYLVAPGVEGAVRSGERAAHRVSRELERAGA